MSRKATMGGAALLGLTILFGWAVMRVRGQDTQEELVRSSSIIFVGTVSELGAASFAGVPVSANTLVVRVDEVLQKPDAVALAQGDDITVLTEDPTLFQESTQATFYAEGWILGAGVAVREVGHEMAGQTMARSAITEKQAEVTRIRAQLNDAELQSRIADAEVVCVGRVVNVRPAEAVAVRGTQPITEHDPEWQEAVIEVETGLKGAEAGDEVVVRFPGSRDVAWYRAPKFTEGQQGTFILHTDDVTGAPGATLRGANVPTYTALDPGDVLPTDEADRVQSLIQQ